MNKLLPILGLTALTSPLFAQVSRIPSINVPIKVGVVGTIQGTSHLKAENNTDDQIQVKEFEINVKGQVHPGVEATTIFAVHPKKGEYHVAIENATLDFTGFANGANAKIGRMFLPFGKQNQLHPEQQPLISRAAFTTQFLGKESLTADGLSVGYLLPLPFFSRIEFGHAKNSIEGEAGNADFSPTRYIKFGRLWTSIEPMDNSELELGVSGLWGSGPEYATKRDETKLTGTDVTYRIWMGAKERITLQSEFAYLNRYVQDNEFNRMGMFLLGSYRTASDMEVGVRWDQTQLASVAGGTGIRTLSLNLMQKFSETYFGRIEYIHDLNNDNPKISAQLVFNLGSHTHVLQ